MTTLSAAELERYRLRKLKEDSEREIEEYHRDVCSSVNLTSTSGSSTAPLGRIFRLVRKLAQDESPTGSENGGWTRWTGGSTYEEIRATAEA